jgi:hypothetical protein
MKTISSTAMPAGRIVALGFGLVVMVALLFLLSPRPANAATFTVNRTGDAGDANLANAACDSNASQSGNQCTLRAAIEEANDTAGTDTINFNISSQTAVKTISPASELPAIDEAVTINGYSQPGASPNTRATGNDAVIKIQLNGTNAGTSAIVGLTIQADDSTVKGLAINRFSGFGVEVQGFYSTGNNVEGNFIGTNARGTDALGNGIDGVRISSASNNTVGGTARGARNLISGNDDSGVLLLGATATGNEILGNYIGTDKSGTAALGNGDDGVTISNASDNTIGGTASGARNVISGNGRSGVQISGTATTGTGNAVLGNRIGTSANGNADLGNSGDGVRLADAAHNTIGGTAAGARNVISGNGQDGVLIEGSLATGNRVEGNFLGTDASGTLDRGNSGEGVLILNAPANTIGGTASGAGNIISGNDNVGVAIVASGATDNEVLSNHIGTRADGSGDLGNSNNGVIILNAAGNTIGGTASGVGNTISGNDANGVEIFGSLATGNEVKGNAIRANDDDGVNVSGDDNTIGGGNLIFSNGSAGVEVRSDGQGNSILSNQIFGDTGLGIDLLGGTSDISGVNNNDDGDPDAGGNNSQNFPVITSATQAPLPLGFEITIEGTLNSTPTQNFTVQCFLTGAPDGSGHGEGEAFKAEDTTVTTGTNGNASFECTFLFIASLEGQNVSATATNEATGDTSEYSQNVGVVAGS